MFGKVLKRIAVGNNAGWGISRRLAAPAMYRH